MSNEIKPDTASAQSMVYRIRIKGHVSRRWMDWFAGLTITLEDNGETLLNGPLIDQAALYGLLRTVRDLGLPLLSVMCVEPNQAAGPESNPWPAGKRRPTDDGTLQADEAKEKTDEQPDRADHNAASQDFRAYP